MESNNDISIEELDQLEQYLAGTMTAEKQEAFRRRLEQEPLLRQKLEETQLLLLGIREAALKNKLDDFHKGIADTTTVDINSRGRSGRKYWLAAASLIVIIGASLLFILNRENKNERLYARYFEADSGLVTAMGSSDNYEFDKAMVDYKTGNYKAALTGWSQLLPTHPGNDTLHYFYGVAQLAIGNADSAVGYLSAVANNPQSVFRSDACWYQGLALLKQDKKQEAITSLRLSNHPRRDELLSNLK